MDNGAEYIIFWQQLLLLSITSNEIGVLRYKENIPFTPDLLATITDTNVDIVRGALNVFQKLGMIDRTEDGDIIIDELIQDLIGSETSVAGRVRKHRENYKMLQCNNMKQICNTEIEIETEIEKEIHTTAEKDKRFEEWYNKYDKKVSRFNAEKLWNKLSIIDKDMCLEGVDKYVQSTPEKQYRTQPDTYLRNRCWLDEIISRNQTGKQSDLNKLLSDVIITKRMEEQNESIF
jgi:predicted phage replisome organizer